METKYQYLYHRSYHATIEDIEQYGLMSFSSLGRHGFGYAIKIPIEQDIWFQDREDGNFSDWTTWKSHPKSIFLRILKKDALKFGKLERDDNVFGESCPDCWILKRVGKNLDDSNCDFAIPPKYLEVKKSKDGDWEKLQQSNDWKYNRRTLLQDRIDRRILKQMIKYGYDPSNIEDYKEWTIRNIHLELFALPNEDWTDRELYKLEDIIKSELWQDFKNKSTLEIAGICLVEYCVGD